jgi:hypothetical protein
VREYESNGQVMGELLDKITPLPTKPRIAV